jgi:hypothetical protein
MNRAHARPPDRKTVANISKYATADGLIPTTLAVGCEGSRELLALAARPGVWDSTDNSESACSAS